MDCAPMQSLYNQKRKSLCLSFATLAVPYYLAHLCSLRLLLNLKSLHHVTQPYAVSIVPESLCSLRTNKSRKVFAYSFALAVFIVTKYLCSLHTLRPPKKSHTSRAPISLHLLRVPLLSWCDLCALAPCAHYWRAGGIGLYMIYFLHRR